MRALDEETPMIAVCVLFAMTAVALVIEALAGFPEIVVRWVGHPVIWMGGLLSRLDGRFNRESDPDDRRQRAGFLALAALLVATGIPAAAVTWSAVVFLPPAVTVLLLGVCASSLLAQRSLHSHVAAVADALEGEGLETGRRAVGRIVGRDIAALDVAGVSRAAIESLAENFADGVVAPTFWLMLLGLPGGALYKAINTADSMIGHRTPRHAAFGFAAAKLDDAVNWVPARLAALLVVAAAAAVPGGSWREAWRIMRRDAQGHPSPNAGWPEAAMAGALGLQLAGPRLYAGRVQDDAFIGDGNRPADATAIRMALRIYRAACGIEIVIIGALAILSARW